MKTNDMLHGFRVLRVREIPEVEGTLYEMEYEKNGAKLLIIDAPTLFEAGYDQSCDFTVSILAPAAVRVGRISERDDISYDDALLRTNAQKDDSFYRERSDRIIINDTDENALKEKANALLLELLSEESL